MQATHAGSISIKALMPARPPCFLPDIYTLLLGSSDTYSPLDGTARPSTLKQYKIMEQTIEASESTHDTHLMGCTVINAASRSLAVTHVSEACNEC